MLLFAICADSIEAPALRPALLPTHAHHLRSLEELRFSAPLARRDGASVSGEGIESSVIILEGEDWAALVKTLLADPYAAGGVWARIDLYEVTAGGLPRYATLVDLTGDARWYLRLAQTGGGTFALADRDRWTNEGKGAVFTAVLERWASAEFLIAPSLAAAERPGALTLAVPVSAGSWTKRP
jgi:uncharacterized protein YciI